MVTPVSEVIPEFGARGKQCITVQQMLTHQSGMNTEIPYGVSLPSDIFNISNLVARVSDECIFHRPGERVSYNAMTAHAVLAEMVCQAMIARGWAAILPSKESPGIFCWRGQSRQRALTG
ncbi:hypothetical protein DRQ32_04755 [bacterium]|nr:MAG: hypothetical protein DRQ32_04755 [bacterium]